MGTIVKEVVFKNLIDDDGFKVGLFPKRNIVPEGHMCNEEEEKLFVDDAALIVCAYCFKLVMFQPLKGKAFECRLYKFLDKELLEDPNLVECSCGKRTHVKCITNTYKPFINESISLFIELSEKKVYIVMPSGCEKKVYMPYYWKFLAKGYDVMFAGKL